MATDQTDCTSGRRFQYSNTEARQMKENNAELYYIILTKFCHYYFMTIY